MTQEAHLKDLQISAYLLITTIFTRVVRTGKWILAEEILKRSSVLAKSITEDHPSIRRPNRPDLQPHPFDWLFGWF